MEATGQVAIERAVQAGLAKWGTRTKRMIISGKAVDVYYKDEKVDEDDLVKHQDIKFSEDAISSLEEWLLGERRERSATKNLLYLWAHTIRLNHPDSPPDDFTQAESWLEGDLTNAIFSFVDSAMSSDELKGLTGYGSAVWKSNIVIAGGIEREHKTRRRCSDIVYIYDTLRKSWDKHQMKARRRSPVVVVADDHIFVFGGYPQPVNPTEFDHLSEEENDLSRYGLTQQAFAQWCEYFNFKSGTGTPLSSKYLPKPPPPYIVAKASFGVHAVYPKKSLILFWMPPLCIVSLNYDTWEWQPFLHINLPIFQDLTGTAAQVFLAHSFCAQFVVLEDFLFWSNRTSICAMDLSGHATLPVYTFPCSESLDKLFSLRKGFPYGARHLFLVHLGKGVLCLLGDTHQSEIWFATFVVQVSKGKEAPTLHLVLDQAGFVEAPKTTIASVFSVSS